MPSEPPAGFGAGVGEEGTGAVLLGWPLVVILFLAALERGGQILLNLEGFKPLAMGRADAEEAPVAHPEDQNGDGQDFGEGFEPASCFADENVRTGRTP